VSVTPSSTGPFIDPPHFMRPRCSTFPPWSLFFAEAPPKSFFTVFPTTSTEAFPRSLSRVQRGDPFPPLPPCTTSFPAASDSAIQKFSQLNSISLALTSFPLTNPRKPSVPRAFSFLRRPFLFTPRFPVEDRTRFTLHLESFSPFIFSHGYVSHLMGIGPPSVPPVCLLFHLDCSYLRFSSGCPSSLRHSGG